MKPSNELFYLIKSLSKSEKRYFKLSSALQQGDKNYLKLFDMIESQKEYDEEEIKNTFAKSVFIKHLPSEKNHLYNLLLKSLRNFHSDRSAASQLQENIKNIQILYDKALYKECSKIVRKSKRIAYDHEEFYFLLELINWERMLVEEGYARGKFNKNIDELVAEEEEVLEKLRNLAEYQILYSKVNYVFRKGGYTRNEHEKQMVNDILEYHLIKGKDTALSMKASTACYYIKGLCAWTNRDLDLAFKNFQLVIDRFHMKPQLIKELPKRYTRVLNNILLYYIDTRNFDKFFESLEHMKSLASENAFRSIDLQIRIFTFSTIAELLCYETLGKFDEGEKVVSDILAGLEKYKHKISKEDVIVYYYNISRHYFSGGDYKKSLDYINRVLNDNEADLRQDIFTFARLFNLIIHYELENYDLLDYIIKSTIRFVKKKSRDYPYEMAIIKHLKKLVRLNQSEKSIVEQLELFKDEVTQIYKDPYQQVTLEYFDIMAWINSKLKGIDFAEYKRLSA